MPHYSILQWIGMIAMLIPLLALVWWLDWLRYKPRLDAIKDQQDREMEVGAYRHPPLSLDSMDSPNPPQQEL